MRWRRVTTFSLVLVPLAGGLFAGGFLASAQDAPAASAQGAPAAGPPVSSAATPTGQPWLGFGTNQDPQDRDGSGAATAWTTGSWALTTSRVGYLRPGLTRINVNLGWFNPSGDLTTYTWGSRPMQDLYRVLSWYNSRKYAVQIGIWHDTVGPPDPSVYTSMAWADAQAALIRHLVSVDGYTSIYGYSGLNEWNCAYMGSLSLTQWQVALRNLASAFAADRLSVPLIGPDTGCGGSSADIPAAQDAAALLSAYEDHYYPSEAALLGDKAESRMASIVSAADRAGGGRKPVYLGEMGVTNPDYQPSPAIDSYAYGLDMFDYGVQVLRSGAAGALAWCLDGFDQGKNCGMWDISGSNGGTVLRPWYYTWSLLSRYFPRAALIYALPGSASLRIAAARVPAGRKSSQWTFALVNRDATRSQVITLRAPGWGSGEFDEYLYSPSGQPADGNGFPVPYLHLWTAKGGLRAGLTVTVPPASAVLLTSMNRRPMTALVTW